jgi:hypothetical protein
LAAATATAAAGTTTTTATGTAAAAATLGKCWQGKHRKDGNQHEKTHVTPHHHRLTVKRPLSYLQAAALLSFEVNKCRFYTDNKAEKT